MPRHLRAFVLLAVLLWQTMAAFGSVALTQPAFELQHLVMHSQDVHHHHHADKTLHLDEAAVEINHLHADSAGGTVALMQSIQSDVPCMRTTSLPTGIHVLGLSPTLEGPLRPPAHRA